MDRSALTAVALNGTLKPSNAPESSSTDRMIGLFADELAKLDCSTEVIRLADHDIKPGVAANEGDGDQWPAIRRRILDADILITGSPVWMGQPSSVIKRALERMDAFLSEKDQGGRMPTFGKVAVVATVDNEDGAHHVSAELFQALNDVGFSIAPNAVGYWVGEAMNGIDFKDLEDVPDVVTSAVRMASVSAAYLARLFKASSFPSLT